MSSSTRTGYLWLAVLLFRKRTTSKDDSASGNVVRIVRGNSGTVLVQFCELFP